MTSPNNVDTTAFHLKMSACIRFDFRVKKGKTVSLGKMVQLVQRWVLSLQPHHSRFHLVWQKILSLFFLSPNLGNIHEQFSKSLRQLGFSVCGNNANFDHTYTLNSQPKALRDKSEGIKSRGFYPRIYPQLKPRAKNLMYLYCLTQENYPSFSKKTKDKLPWAKSKTTRSTTRPPLLGWRCVLVRILVFSFHLLSSSRRWLRWIDSGVLNKGCSVQACSVADPLLQSSLFFLFKWGLRKIRSLSTEWLKKSLTQIKLSLKERLTQIKLFLKKRIIPR